MRHLLAHVRCDAAVLGVTDGGEAADRSILGLLNATPASAQSWCEGPDPLLAEAQADGLATRNRGRCVRATGPLGDLHEAVIATQHFWPGTTRRWFLLAGRRGGGFNPAERERLGLALTGIRDGFMTPREAGLSQTVLREDGDLVLMDAPAGLVESQRPATRGLRHACVQRAASERWGGRKQRLRTPRDLIVDLEDGLGAVWLRTYRWSPAPGLPRLHWVQQRPVGEPGPPPVGEPGDLRIARALAVLGDRYPDPPGLGALSEELGLSMYHFQRLFKAGVGCSPKQYVLRIQLMMACWLLRTTGRSIGDIAVSTGFGSPGHFSSTFRDHAKRSPSDYRAAG
ncbi:helix-turn-helix transcriptional regulator [Phycisphaera mikurensis]|uniref:Putative AraC family transcriptional regulator n=1 Tax=Phycisphaera mikurensis (strain NBRC 102666 / KCTC 22515 / FYK2301M01) TaxID=1142394 RepID=I0IJB8_PHYMF|nr:AraC family transcriptional regulator [Phycisphaera mikurensis]MBB6441845.1 AraC-like DNA-binding protein [Phycisphaera mikurensis]BAM05356.1 putative AraC family transcriptional regulator [Phycisphaera mikurensis NBRC 102666]